MMHYRAMSLTSPKLPDSSTNMLSSLSLFIKQKWRDSSRHLRRRQYLRVQMTQVSPCRERIIPKILWLVVGDFVVRQTAGRDESGHYPIVRIMP